MYNTVQINADVKSKIVSMMWSFMAFGIHIG